MWKYLSPALDEYVKGIAYIEVQDNFDDRWIKGQISRVWKTFLEQGQNSADLVRVNYIIGTDEAGTKLPYLCKYVEKYLSALYPAGIITDAYCVLDDDRLLENEDERKHIMAMLKAEQPKGTNVYLLSNLTSQNVLITNDSIAHTIAMLTLFKDCVPDSYVTGADASRYNEIYFLDNCYAKQGHFLTASSLNVTVPLDGLKAILMTELLSFGKDTPLETGGISDKSVFSETKIRQATTKPIAYLLGMAIPEISRNTKQTRRQWISYLFGKRLELLMDKNTKVEPDSLPNFTTDGVNLYDLLRYTDDGGIYDHLACTALADAKNDLYAAEERFRQWLDSPPSFSKDSPEAEKRRLSPLVTQELWPYIIASEFMRNTVNIQYWHDVIEVLEKRCEHVVDAHHDLMHLLEQVNEKIDECTKKSQILNETFSPFSPSATDYFRKLFNEFANSNYLELTELSMGMTASLVNGEFDKYLKQLDKYIVNSILPSKEFSQPIMDILHDIIANSGSHSDIATALGEWVFNNRTWNIRLKTGYSNLHTEINLYMPAQNAADVKRRYEERGFGRMNLFTEESANHVAVLYHAGAFILEDLFYGSLYKDNDVKNSDGDQ